MMSSPDGRHSIEFQWKGELGMSGPGWGVLSIDGGREFQALSPDVIWSPDSAFVAFVELHLADVPNAQRGQGFSSRVILHRLQDGLQRHLLGKLGLADVKLLSWRASTLALSVNGQEREIGLDSVRW